MEPVLSTGKATQRRCAILKLSKPPAGDRVDVGNSFEVFMNLQNAYANPGKDLSEIDFDDLIHYQNHLINQLVLEIPGKRSKKPLNGRVPELSVPI